MAEEFAEKTEAATPRRRQEARRQGAVARSADLTCALMLVGTLWLLKWFGPGILGALKSMVGQMLGGESLAMGAGPMPPASMHSLQAVAWSLAPLLGGTVLLAVIANIAQVGLLLSTERVVPNFQAVSPMQNLGRIFGSERGPVNLAFSLLKLILVSAIVYGALRDRLATVVAIPQMGFQRMFGLGAGMVFAIGMRVGVVLLVLAVIDYAWQRFQYERKLKMSKQEVKDEQRRMEGDPKMKQRRRQMAGQLVGSLRKQPDKR